MPSVRSGRQSLSQYEETQDVFQNIDKTVTHDWASRRRFNLNSSEDFQRLKFVDNVVSSQKYRWYDFLPRVLWSHCIRGPIIMYIVIMILQFVCQVPSPWEICLPFILGIVVKLLIVGIGDYYRSKFDRVVNNTPVVTVSLDGDLVERTSGELRVSESVSGRASDS
eukprot:GHVU01102318.1.p1 GENE.GHVU01102318.1~~GHVU01102318.1.p1  ORF type:complete len:166 (-),score=8.63 GHVU01102318.1:130-627(-)